MILQETTNLVINFLSDHWQIEAMTLKYAGAFEISLKEDDRRVLVCLIDRDETYTTEAITLNFEYAQQNGLHLLYLVDQALVPHDGEAGSIPNYILGLQTAYMGRIYTYEVLRTDNALKVEYLQPVHFDWLPRSSDRKAIYGPKIVPDVAGFELVTNDTNANYNKHIRLSVVHVVMFYEQNFWKDTRARSGNPFRTGATQKQQARRKAQRAKQEAEAEERKKRRAEQEKTWHEQARAYREEQQARHKTDEDELARAFRNIGHEFGSFFNFMLWWRLGGREQYYTRFDQQHNPRSTYSYEEPRRRAVGQTGMDETRAINLLKQYGWRNGGETTLKKAYRAGARVSHPDIVKDDGTRMKELNAAYELLSRLYGETAL